MLLIWCADKSIKQINRVKIGEKILDGYVRGCLRYPMIDPLTVLKFLTGATKRAAFSLTMESIVQQWRQICIA